MATRHRPTRPRYDALPDGDVRLTFDCPCGVAGDWTVGRTRAEAKARAARICGDHGRTVAHLIAQAVNR